MSLNAGGGGCRVSANEYSCEHGAQINFGDLTPYSISPRRGCHIGAFWCEFSGSQQAAYTVFGSGVNISTEGYYGKDFWIGNFNHIETSEKVTKKLSQQ